jgi:uncharacterized protein YfiM (DUF2279 family)
MIAFVLALQVMAAPIAPADTAAVRASSLPEATLVPEADAWLGADKFKHAAMSYAITAYTFAATDSEPAAVATAALSGILKEIYDRKRGSLFSFRDLVWDAAGIALGYAIVKQTR